VKRDAEGKLRAFFETSLDEASRAEEPIGFDEVAAYVDGQMLEIDREIFESRLAHDPALQDEVADLTAMRRAMLAPRATPAATRTPTARGAGAGTKSMIWMLGAFAAAAGLAGAVVWFAAATFHRSSTSNDLLTAQNKTPAARQPPTPSSPSRVLLLQDNGGVAAFDIAGTLYIKTDSAVSHSLVQDAASALLAGTLPPTMMPRELRSSGPLTLMGESQPSARFGIVAPVATLVRDARPTFRWQSHPRARAYTVVIFTDRLERVASSGELSASRTTWTPDVQLKAGTTYQWQMTALTPDGPEIAPAPPLPEARFRVLSAEQRRALDRQLADAGSSNLLRGLALTRAGVLGEAQQAFEALAAANPASARARELVTNVRQLRGAPVPSATVK
jgi:hypothetical protein